MDDTKSKFERNGRLGEQNDYIEALHRQKRWPIRLFETIKALPALDAAIGGSGSGDLRD